jgi:hypothetical protein
MAAITLEEARAKLATWMAAEETIAGGQAVQYEGRALTRADLRMVGERITYWETKVNQLERGGYRANVRRATPYNA